MKKCLSCGGECKDLGGGNYRCKFCGKTFTESDFDFRPKAKKGADAPVSSDSGVDVFERNINGVLEISWGGRDGVYSGSGFLVDAKGYCITNAHVVTGPDLRHPSSVAARICGNTVNADVVAIGDYRNGRGEGEDLALLKINNIPSGAQVLRFEDFKNVRIGEKVFVLGNSLGKGTCITGGIVSDRRRNVNGKPRLMTDCATNGGNSGGPIFSASGKVIGVIVSSALNYDGSNAEGMNYAIPSDIVTEFIDEVLKR